MRKIKMDQRAQISIEYILLVSIILIIVIVFALVISNQSQQNNIATAVQLGASNATANLVFTNNSQSPVQVTYINMTNSTNNTNINIVVHFSRSVSDQKSTILNGIANSLNSSINTNFTMVQTSSYIYLTTYTGSGAKFQNYNITLG